MNANTLVAVFSEALRRGSGLPEQGLRDGAAAPAARGRASSASIGFVALVLLAPATLVYLSFDAGGYFPSAYGFAAVVMAQALVLRTTLAGRPFEGFSRALAAPLAALVLCAAWQLVSVLWSHATARTLDSYDLTLLYALTLALFGSVRYTRARAAWLIRALAAGLAAVCLIGLVSRVLPHVWPTTSSFFADRLNYPLTYWNAEGMIAVIVLVLGLHLTADRAERPWVRVLAATILPGVAATLLLTFSRGAIGAAVIGLLAYCLLARAGATLVGAVLAVAAVPVAVALHAAWDATALATADPTGPAAIAQGHHLALVIGACMLGACALRTTLLFAERRLAESRLSERARGRASPSRAVRVGLGAGALVALCAIALVAGAAGYLQREYDKFVDGHAGTQTAQTRERLTDPSNDGRLSLWRAAVHVYDAHKLGGAGAGTYQQQYFRYRSEPQYVTDAHSLYLQSLAELGIVGFVLIVVVVGGVLGGLAARIRGPDRALYAALFALALAWAVHQAFDWDWQMPAVTLGLFMLAGLALARPMDGRPGRFGLPVNRTLLALGWLLIAVAPVLVSTSYARLQRGGRELARGDCTEAKHDALASLTLSAKRPQAYVIVGVCDLEQGFAQGAAPMMAQAVALEPENWEGAYWLGIARAAAGVDPRPEVLRALTLNPLEPVVRAAAKQLRGSSPRQWERVAPTLREEALASGHLSITEL